MAEERRLDARVGEEIHLALEAMPGAGYVWEVVDGDDVELVRRETARPAPDAIGASTEQVLVLMPRSAGKHSVTLCLKRPWEREAVREVLVHIAAHD